MKNSISLVFRSQAVKALVFLHAVFCLVILPGDVVWAELFVDVEPSRFPFGAFPADFTEDVALNAPPSNTWISLVLTAFSTAGSIAAVDVSLSGTMHQAWDRANVAAPSIPTARHASTTNGDSHLLFPSNGLAFEDNNDINLAPYAIPAQDTDTRDYGIGTFLRGEWFTPSENSTNAVDLAYIVVPRDSLFSANTVLKLEVRLTNGQRESRDVFVCAGGEGTVGACNYDPPEIGVSGNQGAAVIRDNDTTPSLFETTDFGTVAVGTIQERTFNIRNLGIAPLELGPPMLTGPFSIVGEFPTNIRGNLNQIFKIALDTSARGTFQGSISFVNNDSDENPFNFALSATVIPEPCSFVLLLIVGIAVTCQRRR